ncbi:mechanosensitive ion channel domain-containing protein [Halothiobacillus sp. DCM-1]|uniref:mechanosensitive ion channel domain-containing protein n=1 Tax=Halothiobacillus sp. DCM-1 TaxID=3112558 RepID=UPI00324E64A5
MRILFRWFLIACLGLSLPVGAAGNPPPSAPPSSGTAPAPSAADYQALAKLLENPESRAVIVQELRRLGTAPDAATPAAQPSPSLSSQLAQESTEALQKAWVEAEATLQHLHDGWHELSQPEVGLTLIAQAGQLLALIGIAYSLWFIAGLFVRRIAQRLDAWAGQAECRQHLLRAALALLGLGSLGLLILAAINALGTLVISRLLTEEPLQLWRLALVLNAFVLLELLRMVLRLILMPSYAGLRLFVTDGMQAAFWVRRFSVLILVLGYGVLVVVPILRLNVDLAAAQIVVWLLAIFGLLYSSATILSQRRALRASIRRWADRHPSGVIGWLLRVLAHAWHYLALAYVGMVFLVGMTRPGDALPFIVRASGLTILAIAVALLVSALLTQWLDRVIQLPDHHRKRLPSLEPRLNAYLPWLLRLIRGLILLGTVGVLLSIWHVLDMTTWLGSAKVQGWMGSVLAVLIILGGALLLWLVVASAIEAKLNSEHLPSTRVQTLLSLFRNAAGVSLLIIAVMMSLSQLGVNIGPLLAGAGVIGLAVGFGAQKLVQDVITGIFIQLENAINTGDVISVGGITGTAERLSIRSVGLRDAFGTYHIVPFSAVSVVSNFMREFAFHKAEYGIAYRESIDEAIAALQSAFDELMTDAELRAKVLEPISIPGVTDLAASSVNIRVQIKTRPGEQWAVGRAYNRLVKKHFDAAGIEIPYPHTTVYFGEDKSGHAPPLRVQNLPGSDAER